LSDDDTPSPGDASNPIVLDSDDEADPILAERVSSVQPLLDTSLSTPRRKNIQPGSPSGSNYLARFHASQCRASPGASDTGDEFRDAELRSIERTPLSPHSGVDSVQAVPPVVNANADQMPLPIRDSSEIQDKMPNTVPENMREAQSPVASSPSPMSPKSRNKGVSDRLAMARISLSPSPNRGHDPPAEVSANSSLVPVRGSLHSGSSELCSRVTTAEPASPSRSSRDIEKEGDARLEEAPTLPRANSPCNVTSSTLVSMARKMSIGVSPTRSSVAGRSYLEISDGLKTTALDDVFSAPTGEPFR
jgi:hypothetical protein